MCLCGMCQYFLPSLPLSVIRKQLHILGRGHFTSLNSAGNLLAPHLFECMCASVAKITVVGKAKRNDAVFTAEIVWIILTL